MDFFKDLPLKPPEMLKLLGMEVTPELQVLLDVAEKKVEEQPKVLAAVIVISIVTGIKKRVDRVVDALEAIAKELKEHTLEMEINRGNVLEIAKAINNNIVDREHTVR